MTVSGTESRERYDGNGVTVSFPITFVYGKDADINVTHIDALGVETAWVLDGVGDTGFTIVSGAVVANTAPEDETELVIYRVTPITQLVDYVENRATPATVTEDTLDKLTMITQELDDASDRAMTLPVTAEESVSAELPLPEALKLIRWNAAADALINVTSAELNGEILASSFVVDKYVDGVDFTAGVTTQLVLTSVPGSENNTQIYFDGVYQEKGTYSLSVTTITFDAAIPGGVSGVEVMYIVGAPPSVPADASVTTVKLGGIDTIAEETVDAGVTVDGVKLKDSIPYCDIISEKTGDAGVTVDGCEIKDGVAALANKVVDQGGGANLLCKVVDIGDWDMNATNSVAVAHGLTLSKIRTVEAFIRNDSDNQILDIFSGFDVADTTPQGFVGTIDATNVTLDRLTGGGFDSASYAATPFNRGWITIWYTE